jgi:predicted ArsR family transcriptional regulator
VKIAAAPPRGASAGPEAVDGRTRDRVMRALLEHGGATAAELGHRLGLSPAGIRRHLDALVATGAVTVRDIRSDGARGRGRPARAYVLTDSARSSLPHAYDDIAVSALRFLREAGGDPALTSFAAAQTAAVEDRYRDQLTDVPPERRAEALAEMLSADGYAASASARRAGVQSGGTQLCQHHCPVQHVAEEFPQLCEAETALLGRLLGTHVQRLATIAHGDGVCTTFVPDSAVFAPRTAAVPHTAATPRTASAGRTTTS